MKKNKILIVSPYFAPFSGVGANRMISLAIYLRDSEYSVTVVRNVQESLRSMYTAEVPEGIEYFDINLIDYLPFSEMADLYCSRIDELLNARTFDCLIISLGPFYTLKMVETIKQKVDVPVILDFRDLFAYERLRHEDLKSTIGHFVFYKRRIQIERPAVYLADAVVTCGPDDRQIMSKHYSDYIGKIVKISNGYDENRLNKLRINNKKVELSEDKNIFQIGVFGKLSIYNKKLTRKLLMAIKRVQERGYKIELVHMGAEELDTIQMAKEIGLQDGSYHYLGSREYSEGIELLSKVDFLSFVYCAPKGYGTKIFDYIYLNKPVLLMARKGTVLGSFVNSFRNGFECTTVSQYEKALLQVINNREYVLDSEFDKTLYSRKKQNGKFLDLIQELLENRK